MPKRFKYDLWLRALNSFYSMPKIENIYDLNFETS